MVWATLGGEVFLDASVADVHRVGQGRSARGFFLAVAVKAVLAARRADEDWRVDRAAEQFRGDCDLVDVRQEAGPQDDAAKGEPVLGERDLVLAPLVHVVESHWIEQPACEVAEVEDVGELSRIG